MSYNHKLDFYTTMSTYTTNVHHRIQENISISRYPHDELSDGITNQRVIFANENNVYNGKFIGTISAEDAILQHATINNSQLNGSNIIDSQLSNVKLLGNIQISSNEQLIDINELVNNVDTNTNNIKYLSSEISSNDYDISCIQLSVDDIVNGPSGIIAISTNIVTNLENKISNDISTAISGLSNTVDDRLSTQYNDLTDQLSSVSAELCSSLSSTDEIVNEIKNDVRGHLNHKGHIDLTNGLYEDNLKLSTIFGLYYNAVQADPPAYLSNVSLNNGWMYKICTTKPYYTSDDPKFTLEDNDYLIICNHNTSLSCIDISSITPNDVDIIESVYEDSFRKGLSNHVLCSNTFDETQTFNNIVVNKSLVTNEYITSASIECLSAKATIISSLSIEDNLNANFKNVFNTNNGYLSSQHDVDQIDTVNNLYRIVDEIQVEANINPNGIDYNISLQQLVNTEIKHNIIYARQYDLFNGPIDDANPNDVLRLFYYKDVVSVQNVLDALQEILNRLKISKYSLADKIHQIENSIDALDIDLQTKINLVDLSAKHIISSYLPLSGGNLTGNLSIINSDSLYVGQNTLCTTLSNEITLSTSSAINKLSTDLSIDFSFGYNTNDNIISARVAGNTMWFSANKFTEASMLSTVKLDIEAGTGNRILWLYFKTESGINAVSVDLNEIMPLYQGGDGIDIHFLDSHYVVNADNTIARLSTITKLDAEYKGAGKILTALYQTDGLISAEFATIMSNDVSCLEEYVNNAVSTYIIPLSTSYGWNSDPLYYNSTPIVIHETIDTNTGTMYATPYCNNIPLASEVPFTEEYQSVVWQIFNTGIQLTGLTATRKDDYYILGNNFNRPIQPKLDFGVLSSLDFYPLSNVNEDSDMSVLISAVISMRDMLSSLKNAVEQIK